MKFRYRNFVIAILPASTHDGFIFHKKNKKLDIDYMSYSVYPTQKRALKIAKKSIDRNWENYKRFT